MTEIEEPGPTRPIKFNISKIRESYINFSEVLVS